MIELWTILIGVTTAIACAICGTFLVLRKDALVAEGLAHAVLPGIVVAFVLVRDRASPLLVASAALSGLLMVALVAAIRRTGVVHKDASLGVVFPALFSLGVLLANAELAGVHFHADCILDGNLALSPLDRLVVGGRDLGPRQLWVMGGVLVAVLVVAVLFFKELKVAAFDRLLATSLGLRPDGVHFVWLALVSLTTVAAFDTAGSVLVVALMIAPPVAASLWTDDVKAMLWIAVAIAAGSAVVGERVAFVLDVAPNGPMATVAGLVVVLSVALAPRRGALARRRERSTALRDSEARLVAARLDAESSRAASDVASELGWTVERVRAAVARGGSLAPVVVDGDRLSRR